MAEEIHPGGCSPSARAPHGLDFTMVLPFRARRGCFFFLIRYFVSFSSVGWSLNRKGWWDKVLLSFSSCHEASLVESDWFVLWLGGLCREWSSQCQGFLLDGLADCSLSSFAGLEVIVFLNFHHCDLSLFGECGVCLWLWLWQDPFTFPLVLRG